MINAWIWIDGGESIDIGHPVEMTPSGEGTNCSWDVPVFRGMTIGMAEILVDDQRYFCKVGGITRVGPGDRYHLEFRTSLR